MTACAGIETPPRFSVTVGGDATFELTVRDKKTGKPVDITSARVYFTARVRIEDEIPVFAKRSLNAGGADTQILVDPDQVANKGKFKVFVTFADTKDLDYHFSPIWVDSWVIQQTNRRYQVVEVEECGIKPTVTRFAA